MCHHSIVKCLDCGAEGSPAQLLARRPRTVTPAMIDQRKNAGAISAAKRRTHCRECGAKLGEKYLDRLNETVLYCHNCGESYEPRGKTE